LKTKKFDPFQSIDTYTFNSIRLNRSGQDKRVPRPELFENIDIIMLAFENKCSFEMIHYSIYGGKC